MLQVFTLSHADVTMELQCLATLYEIEMAVNQVNILRAKIFVNAVFCYLGNVGLRQD